MKIRNKLAFLFALLVASVLLFFSQLVYYSSASYRQQEFNDRLEEKAVTTAQLLFEVEGVDEKMLKLFDQKKLTSLHEEEVTIYDENNHVVYDSGSDQIAVSDEVMDQVRKTGKVYLSEGENEGVGLLYSHGRQLYVVLISAVDLYGNTKLNYLALVLAVCWLVSVGVVILMGWFFAGRALAPISDVINQVDRITASNLNLRVEAGQGKDEIAQLASKFNQMLAHLEEAFLVQKSFVSNASHEIRTPLTIMTGQIEVTLLQERSAEEYKKVLHSVLEDVRNLTQLANGLLELAQASGDVSAIKFTEVRIDELLWQARSELLKKRPAYSVKISFEELSEDEDDYTMRGNEPLLKTAFLNLMENGCKFSTNHHVDVTLILDRKNTRIRFTDQGMGIAEKDMPHIFEPFYRSQHTMSVSGHGVGLALTEKIIHLHQGLIEVKSKINQGTTFEIQFYR